MDAGKWKTVGKIHCTHSWVVPAGSVFSGVMLSAHWNVTWVAVNGVLPRLGLDRVKTSTGPGSHLSVHSLPLTLVLHIGFWCQFKLDWGAMESLENPHLFIFSIMCFEKYGSPEGFNPNSTSVTLAAFLPGHSLVVLQKQTRIFPITFLKLFS